MRTASARCESKLIGVGEEVVVIGIKLSFLCETVDVIFKQSLSHCTVRQLQKGLKWRRRRNGGHYWLASSKTARMDALLRPLAALTIV